MARPLRRCEARCSNRGVQWYLQTSVVFKLPGEQNRRQNLLDNTSQEAFRIRPQSLISGLCAITLQIMPPISWPYQPRLSLNDTVWRTSFDMTLHYWILVHLLGQSFQALALCVAERLNMGHVTSNYPPRLFTVQVTDMQRTEECVQKKMTASSYWGWNHAKRCNSPNGATQNLLSTSSIC